MRHNSKSDPTLIIVSFQESEKNLPKCQPPTNANQQQPTSQPARGIQGIQGIQPARGIQGAAANQPTSSRNLGYLIIDMRLTYR